jgi:hypothetical protein
MSADPCFEDAMTPLRELELRSRGLSLADQMAECVDLLQSPDVISADLEASVACVMDPGSVMPPLALRCDDPEGREGFFYPSREISVLGDGGSFTCLSTGIEFRGGEGGHEGESRPIDYAAVTCEARPFPVLGFVQSADDESAYPLLLRAFSTLIELARPESLDALDREIYRGLLGAAPLFDLAVVLWDDDRDDDPRRPLCELGRDLAEILKSTLNSSKRFPPVLNDVLCLRMNPARQDFRVRSAWRV